MNQDEPQTGRGMLRRFGVLLCAVLGLALAACVPKSPPPQIAARELHITPLLVQQRQAYEETATGIFVSIADFEDLAQEQAFSVEGAGRRRIIATNTRTGAGALEVTLEPAAKLVCRLKELRNFRHYTLLSMAVFSPTLRDDLRVRLTSGSASWTCHGVVLRQGWNTVLFDVRDLAAAEGFDLTSIDAISVELAQCDPQATLVLDDIMLLDNRRRIAPTPPGVGLVKDGLDYTIELPSWSRPLKLARRADGLWRLDDDQQPVVELKAQALSAGGSEPAAEDLECMGPRRVGTVEVLETGPCRLRLANTWYFPARGGEWASLSVRQIRWEYTFYPDGRWITSVQLNNAGGDEIGSVRIAWPQEVAVAGRGVGREIVETNFAGPAGRWAVQASPHAGAAEAYLKPAPLGAMTGVAVAHSAGDADGDGFDESQGCYSLQSQAMRCRFAVPAAAARKAAAFRVGGEWIEPTAGAMGLPLRDIQALPDGGVLLVLPQDFGKPVNVELMSSKRP
jgi:hypothetical protein